jgi:hypothetical protein
MLLINKFNQKFKIEILKIKLNEVLVKGLYERSLSANL